MRLGTFEEFESFELHQASLLGSRAAAIAEKALKVKDEEIAKLKAGLNQIKASIRTEGPEKLLGSAGSKDINQARRDYIDGKSNVYPG